ncbi:MAG: hypothetical protein O2816_02980 [Planctomycetota bacterium]|nr:hypothetical protein [Planctomycetota bacterium]
MLKALAAEQADLQAALADSQRRIQELHDREDVVRTEMRDRQAQLEAELAKREAEMARMAMIRDRERADLETLIAKERAERERTIARELSEVESMRTAEVARRDASHAELRAELEARMQDQRDQLVAQQDDLLAARSDTLETQLVQDNLAAVLALTKEVTARQGALGKLLQDEEIERSLLESVAAVQGLRNRLSVDLLGDEEIANAHTLLEAVTRQHVADRDKAGHLSDLAVQALLRAMETRDAAQQDEEAEILRLLTAAQSRLVDAAGADGQPAAVPELIAQYRDSYTRLLDLEQDEEAQEQAEKRRWLTEMGLQRNVERGKLRLLEAQERYNEARAGADAIKERFAQAESEWKQRFEDQRRAFEEQQGNSLPQREDMRRSWMNTMQRLQAQPAQPAAPAAPAPPAAAPKRGDSDVTIIVEKGDVHVHLNGGAPTIVQEEGQRLPMLSPTKLLPPALLPPPAEPGRVSVTTDAHGRFAVPTPLPPGTRLRGRVLETGGAPVQGAVLEVAPRVTRLPEGAVLELAPRIAHPPLIHEFTTSLLPGTPLRVQVLELDEPPVCEPAPLPPECEEDPTEAEESEGSDPNDSVALVPLEVGGIAFPVEGRVFNVNLSGGVSSDEGVLELLSHNIQNFELAPPSFDANQHIINMNKMDPEVLHKLMTANLPKWVAPQSPDRHAAAITALLPRQGTVRVGNELVTYSGQPAESEPTQEELLAELLEMLRALKADMGALRAEVGALKAELKGSDQAGRRAPRRNGR